MQYKFVLHCCNIIALCTASQINNKNYKVSTDIKLMTTDNHNDMMLKSEKIDLENCVLSASN